MKKKVKGGIEKHYCDVCGKNIYDHVPKGTFTDPHGLNIPEYGIRKHCDYVSIRRITKQGDWCKECYERLGV